MDGWAEERGEARRSGQAMFAGNTALRRRRPVPAGDGCDEEALRQCWTLVLEDLELIGRAHRSEAYEARRPDRRRQPPVKGWICASRL